MSGALDFRDRDTLFDALENAPFDLLVIGGGVTGAGVARDAAMRGLRVALVEARDFASGTSSRSSKMIHGGLRYLAQGDLGLVREAASERKAVEAIAPHLARRTPFVIPARNAAAVAKLNAGLWAFEKLGGVARDRKHQTWSREELARQEPAIETEGLAGAVVYPEYLTDDARLTLANVRSAVAYGAVVLNYAPVQEILVTGGKASGAVIGDALSLSQPRARVVAKAVVNAAGPWVDALRRLEDGAAPARLTLTKGVHLVVPAAKLPVSRTIVFPAADKRSVFAVPKGEMTYLGTTDTFYETADYWPRIETADVDYLLAAAARRFRCAPLTPGDITAAWSGVRPLVAEEGKSPSDISRHDEVWTGPHGVISIAGGKLTAYRRMAERIVDTVLEALGQRGQACATAQTPLIGGDVDVDKARLHLMDEGLTELEAARLVQLYGSESAQAAGGPAVEARRAVLFEGAATLEDYWSRRSARACFDADAGLAALAPAAAEMAGLLGWSPDETQRQIAACRTIHDESLAFQGG